MSRGRGLYLGAAPRKVYLENFLHSIKVRLAASLEEYVLPNN
jgi:hypothetical protein